MPAIKKEKTRQKITEKRFTLVFSHEVFRQLREAADRDNRLPGAMARHLIMKGLEDLLRPGQSAK